MSDAKHTPEEVPWHEIADDVCRTRDSMLAADPELWKGKEKQAFDAARSVIEAIWRASKARRAASTGHTPEPWYLQSGDWPVWIRTARDGYVIVRAESPYFGHGAERENRANGERVVACVNACAGMSDPAAEIAALRTEVEHLRQWIGLEQYRSDSRSAADLRAKMEHYRAEAERLKEIERRYDRMTNEEVKHKIGFESELAAYRRDYNEAIDAIKAVGYTTPHGESDSLGEAVAWLVAEAERLRKAEEESDAARHAMAQRLTEIATAAYGYAPPDRAYGWATLADEVKRLRAVHVAADRLADAVESANVGGFIDIGEVLGSVIPAVEAYRKERAS